MKFIFCLNVLELKCKVPQSGTPWRITRAWQMCLVWWQRAAHKLKNVPRHGSLQLFFLDGLTRSVEFSSVFVSLFLWVPADTQPSFPKVCPAHLVNYCCAEKNMTLGHLGEFYHMVKFLLTFRYSSAEVAPSLFPFLLSPPPPFLPIWWALEHYWAMKHLHGIRELESVVVSFLPGDSLTHSLSITTYHCLFWKESLLSWTVRCQTL